MALLLSSGNMPQDFYGQSTVQPTEAPRQICKAMTQCEICFKVEILYDHLASSGIVNNKGYL
jgi:hypothetical protein